MVELPSFAGDDLDPARGGGDLVVQACADDPLVAFHAVHNLARLARGVAALRWSQLGFGRTSSTSRHQDTPRNLMGYKDGTNNVQTSDDAVMRRARVGRIRRPRVDARRHLHGRAPHPHPARGVGSIVPGRAAADDRPAQVQRRAPRLAARVRHRGPRRARRQRPARGSRRRAHPGSGARHQRRGPPAPPGLFVRRRGRRARPAGCRAVLRLLPARPGQAVRHRAATVGGPRRVERVHPPHRQRALRAVLGGVSDGGWIGQDLLGT